MEKKYISYIKVFSTAYIMMLIILVPGIIAGEGYYIYAGDYAFQQVPFAYHVSDAVHKGNTGWDWITNLGSDFIGSYSYYSLGSVFFWLTAWIPDSKTVVFLMPFVISLKVAMAAITSFTWIKNHVKKDSSAFLGAILYAFSGFQLVSLIFNTFADAIAIFPVLLLSFDRLVKEDKRIGFAVIVAVMALDNYFLFYGQAVFILIYYIFMLIKKEYRFTVKNFIAIVFEAVTGVMIAAVILIPAYFSTFSVGRASDFILGVDMISYRDNNIMPKILQSIFIMPDPPGRSMLFTTEKNEWGTISFYIPIFAVTGLWAYIKKNKDYWLSSFIKLCFVIAIVPVFNSAFFMFNDAYYARWLYMPVLLMCTATAVSIDENYDLTSGIKLQAGGLAVLAVVSALPKTIYTNITSDQRISLAKGETAKTAVSDMNKKILWFSMSDYPHIFWQTMVFAAMGLLFIYYYNNSRDRKDIIKKITIITLAFTTATSAVFMENSRKELIVSNLGTRETLIDFKPELDESEFFRINDVNTSLNNHNFIWGYPTISSFHSINIDANEKFYENAGTNERVFRNDYTEDDFPVYGLFSVKYIFNHSTGDDLNVENVHTNLEGFELYDKQGCYYIYENKHFVPMGFMYDYCITDERLRNYIIDLDLREDEDKTHYLQLVLMRALIISEEDQEKYADVIKPLPDSMLENLSADTYLSDCDERASAACSTFEYDTHGFRAEIDTEKSGLVFFSVPVFRGWSAKVNGKDAEIITSQYGFSAVKVEKGENIIEFSYETYGLKTGKLLTFTGLGVLAVYFVFCCVQRRRLKNTVKI